MCAIPLINLCYSQFTKTRTFLKPHDHPNYNYHTQACNFVSLCMFLSYRFTPIPPAILHADCEQRSCTKLYIMMQPRHPLSLNYKCFPSIKKQKQPPRVELQPLRKQSITRQRRTGAIRTCTAWARSLYSNLFRLKYTGFWQREGWWIEGTRWSHFLCL